MRVLIQEEVLEIRLKVVSVKHRRVTTSMWNKGETVDVSTDRKFFSQFLPVFPLFLFLFILIFIFIQKYSWYLTD